MNISKILDQAADSLEQVDWKKLTKDIIKTWDLVFKIIVITMVLTHLAFKAGVSLVYRLNDLLAANWVKMIVPQPPVMKEEENEEEEQEDAPLPATPSPELLVIPDPWEGPEVELMLPLAPMAILFTAPLLLSAAQAPVALLAAGQDVVQQTPPAATNGRRKRGRRAHASRNRQPA